MCLRGGNRISSLVGNWDLYLKIVEGLSMRFKVGPKKKKKKNNAVTFLLTEILFSILYSLYCRVYTEGSSPCPSSFYIRPPHVGGDGDGGEVATEVIFPLLFVFVVLAACVGAAVGYRYWRRRQNNEHQFEQL